MKDRQFYLEDIPLEQARQRFAAALERAGSAGIMPGEQLPIEKGMGRVTAEAIWAVVSSPHYHASAMDGVAVRAEDTIGASEVTPIKLRIGEEAQWIDTGEPLPGGYNAVIMIEYIQQIEEKVIEIMSPVAPWQHVRSMGEDIVSSELLLPQNHLMRPVDLGAVAQAGITSVNVYCQPRVAIIPTGSELVSPGSTLKPGDIIESNSLMLAGMVKEWGAIATTFPITPDEHEQIEIVLRQALAEHDIVIINAGSSAGSEDYTNSIITKLGEVTVHGAAIRPGHPVVLGIVNRKPVVGIPGYPVSAALTMELFVKPLVYRMLGVIPPERSKVEATMTRKVFSHMGDDEFLRVKIGKVGDKMVATPLQRGAGVVMSLVRADGLVCVPRGSEGVHEGEKVQVELLRRLEEVENTIVIIGSHDLALDVLANHLHKQYPQRSISSSNVGSIGGLLALKRGEAHLAGSHLLDEETGEYNIPDVKRLLSDQDIVIINLVYRDQGLIVARGNPRGITGLEDLASPQMSFVNRQKGAGTRVLLDLRLRDLGINQDQITGYERVEYTHLAVAAAVISGSADAGLGVKAAANALDLDFVPLFKERYDLVIPRLYYESPFLEPLLDVLRQASFQAEVEALGGYDTSEMGNVVAMLKR
ncbi:molybdopterin biosynthesis protein [Chloroflexota bacterium]